MPQNHPSQGWEAGTLICDASIDGIPEGQGSDAGAQVRCWHSAWSCPHSSPATRGGPRLCDARHRGTCFTERSFLLSQPSLSCPGASPTRLPSSLHSTRRNHLNGGKAPTNSKKNYSQRRKAMSEKVTPVPCSAGGAAGKSVSVGFSPSRPASVVGYSFLCASLRVPLFHTHPRRTPVLKAHSGQVHALTKRCPFSYVLLPVLLKQAATPAPTSRFCCIGLLSALEMDLHLSCLRACASRPLPLGILLQKLFSPPQLSHSLDL